MNSIEVVEKMNRIAEIEALLTFVPRKEEIKKQEADAMNIDFLNASAEEVASLSAAAENTMRLNMVLNNRVVDRLMAESIALQRDLEVEIELRRKAREKALQEEAVPVVEVVQEPVVEEVLPSQDETLPD